MDNNFIKPYLQEGYWNKLKEDGNAPTELFRRVDYPLQNNISFRQEFYIYDINGRLEYKTIKDNICTITTYYEYYNSGELYKETKHIETTTIFSYVYEKTYSIDGKLLTNIEYNKDKSIFAFEVNNYYEDENYLYTRHVKSYGLPVLIIKDKKTGVVTHTIECNNNNYDITKVLKNEDDNILKKLIYNPKNIEEYCYVNNEYSGENKVLEYYESDTDIQFKNFQYDNNGNILYSISMYKEFEVD